MCKLGDNVLQLITAPPPQGTRSRECNICCTCLFLLGIVKLFIFCHGKVMNTTALIFLGASGYLSWNSFTASCTFFRFVSGSHEFSPIFVPFHLTKYCSHRFLILES